VSEPATPFERLGGEAGVRRLVDRFYDLMDELDEARDIRLMHPEDLTESRDKLWMFLCGFLGGPPLYVQRHGHPRLRARHLPFPIGEIARDQWLRCMDRALEEQVDDSLLRMQLSQTFHRVADHMRNRPG
jgi:hemoglobin